MIIQITNNCTMECPHCMQDSKIGDYHMSFTTFDNALRFGHFMGTVQYNISGGEPTSHPDFVNLIRYIDRFLNNNCLDKSRPLSAMFPSYTVESNGMFINDREIVESIKKLLESIRFAAMQICSMKEWYKSYDFILKNKKKFENISKKVYVFTGEISTMKDLGRARINRKANKRAADDKYHMSCLNGTLAAIQCINPKKFSEALTLSNKSCTPIVDWLGNVHISESITCPSVGNVNMDSFDDIYNNMRNFRPCGKCYGFKRFMKSNTAIIKNAKIIMDL